MNFKNHLTKSRREQMNNKLQLSNNKTLKLSNVLMMEIDLGTESDNDGNRSWYRKR